MKKTLCLLLFCQIIIAQTDSLSTNLNDLDQRYDDNFTVQITAGGQLLSSLSDGYFSEAYDPSLGINVGILGGIKNLGGIGINYSRTELSLDSQVFLGDNFEKEHLATLSFFVYYEHFITKNLLATINFGYFNGSIRHKVNEGNSYFTGNYILNYNGIKNDLQVSYYLNEKQTLRAFASSNFHFSLSNSIDAPRQESDYLNKNNFVTFALGLIVSLENN
ncbi:hypothetical protein [Psychroflexus aestuariivivens]|uniref:hypothetical protein n=1 Tax=Psychroflexus aestuariivivens TaxID=1795040 RepID=UPI000FDBC974|nr:hypothetical protein [Psychroflexus aestuariivivens]